MRRGAPGGTKAEGLLDLRPGPHPALTCRLSPSSERPPPRRGTARSQSPLRSPGSGGEAAVSGGQRRPGRPRAPRPALTSSARGWRASSCRSRALRKHTPRSGGPLRRHRAPRGGTRPGRAGLTWRQEAGQLHLSPPLLAGLAPGAALLLPGGVQLPPHSAGHPPAAPGPPPHVPAVPTSPLGRMRPASAPPPPLPIGYCRCSCSLSGSAIATSDARQPRGGAAGWRRHGGARAAGRAGAWSRLPGRAAAAGRGATGRGGSPRWPCPKGPPGSS